MIIKPSRRGFLTGLTSLIVTAPAIVKAEVLMPVKKIIAITDYTGEAVDIDVLYGSKYLNIDVFIREAIKLFKNTDVFIRKIDEEYERDMISSGLRVGDKIKIKI